MPHRFLSRSSRRGWFQLLTSLFSLVIYSPLAAGATAELPSLKATSAESDIAAQRWIVPIPGGVPANQPLDTPQKWVIRVIPNTPTGNDASVVLGSQEIVRFRSSQMNQSAYDRAVQMASVLQAAIHQSSSPSQLRNHLRLQNGDTPQLLLGNQPLATVDTATAQAAGFTSASLAVIWQRQLHKALFATWETITPLVSSNKTLANKPTTPLPSAKPPQLAVLKPTAAPTVTATSKVPSSPPTPVAATLTTTAPQSSALTAPAAMALPTLASAAPTTPLLTGPSTPEPAPLTKAFAKPQLGETTPAILKPVSTPNVIQTGMASWYGDAFHGRRTSSGQRFDMHRFTAAHRTLPFGTLLKVTNLRNGRSVLVTVNDRGPWGHGRIIDLSKAAAREIGLVSMGVAKVSLAIMPKKLATALP